MPLDVKVTPRAKNLDVAGTSQNQESRVFRAKKGESTAAPHLCSYALPQHSRSGSSNSLNGTALVALA